MSSEREIVVSVTSDELEAEVIRGRLETEGIPARVAYRSRYGLPSSWAPIGLGYGSGSFEVRVREGEEREARALTQPEERARSRKPFHRRAADRDAR